MSKNKYFEKFNNLNEVYDSSSTDPIDRKAIKSISKELCRSYRNGSIPENTFVQLIEHLMSFYIEKDLEEKFLAKSYIFEEKLNKIRQYN